MSLGAAIPVFLVLLLLSATFSGSETGVYSISRVRLDAEARQGRRAAQLLRRLLENETGLLITLLIGNNLMLELATHLFEAGVDRWEGIPEWSRELFVALLLTPIVFSFGELLPKDLFHQRPHLLLSIAAPVLSLARAALLPLAIPLQMLSRALERVFGVANRDLARALSREEVLELLQEGRREGGLAPQAEELARNVLRLRQTPVSAVMLPWKAVKSVQLDDGDEEVRRVVTECPYTRVPAQRTGEDGRPAVVGYLHQLDVLRLPEGTSPAGELRPIPSFPSELPVDRGLARMRISGQRVAVVGTAEAPEGLVTLMDLVATLSGGLVA